METKDITTQKKYYKNMKRRFANSNDFGDLLASKYQIKTYMEEYHQSQSKQMQERIKELEENFNLSKECK